MNKLLGLLLLCAGGLLAQNNVNDRWNFTQTIPTGSCNPGQAWVVMPAGSLYTCVSGVPTLYGTGGGANSISATLPLSTVPAPITGTGTVSETQSSATTNGWLSSSDWNAFATNPTAGVPANQLSSGCGFQYTSGLSFTVGLCNYSIAGVDYQSQITNLTLATADPTNPRIDAIVVDNAIAPAGEAVVITGTPAASPATPAIDPSTQLAIAFILVNAGATTPANITVNTIYDENTEWTCSATAHLNCGSTSNPYHLLKDIEATNAALNNNVQLVDPAAGTVDLASQNSLLFYIRSKGQWPTGTGGSTAARFINIFWKNGSTIKGVAVTLRDGAFGFSSANTTGYQQISIPASAFGIFGIPVTTLEFQVSGPSGSSNIGFYIDWVTLQSGATNNPLPTTLMNFKGTWNGTATYNANDTVVSGGIGYVALVQNTNVAVSTSTTWASLGQQSGVYSQTFTAQTSVSLAHNANTTAVAVECYDNGSPPNLIVPQNTALTDANHVTVTFGASQSGKCIVVSQNPVTGNGGGSGNVTWNTNGIATVTGSAVNFVPGVGIGLAGTNSGGTYQLVPSINTAVVVTNANLQANKPLFCNSATGNASYTCSLSAAAALTAYTQGNTFLLVTDASSATTCTLNIDSLGVKTITRIDGTTACGTQIVAGQPNWVYYDGTVFRLFK